MEVTKLLRIIGFIAYPLILLGSLYKLFSKINGKTDSTSNKIFNENKKDTELETNNNSFFMTISFIATLIGIIYYFLTNEDE